MVTWMLYGLVEFGDNDARRVLSRDHTEIHEDLLMIEGLREQLQERGLLRKKSS
jgi:hypothetical protein